MTPSGRFRECIGDIRHVRQQTLRQNVVMTWKLFAAKSKAQIQDEMSSLIENQNRGSGETPAVTDSHNLDRGDLGVVPIINL